MIIIYLFMAASILASLFILSACIAAARVERGPSKAEARQQTPLAPVLSSTGWIKVHTAEARQQAPSAPPAPPPLKHALPSDFAP